jgi:hypothetical protein
MSASFRISTGLLAEVRRDLERKHPFALERVGFISARPAASGSMLSIIACDYASVADEDYVNDPRVGASIGPSAMSKAMQIAYKGGVSMFHVHMHEHAGAPWFSGVDLREYPKFVPDFFNAQRALPHGALLLSHDTMAGLYWRTKDQGPLLLDEIIEVGAPLRIFRNER